MGYLSGERNKGLAAMFTMTTGVTGVGIQAWPPVSAPGDAVNSVTAATVHNRRRTEQGCRPDRSPGLLRRMLLTERRAGGRAFSTWHSLHHKFSEDNHRKRQWC